MTHKIVLKEEDYDLDFLSTTYAELSESHETVPYKILIADDDNEMHVATKVLLRDFRFEGRPLTFFDAYSGKETLERLAEQEDIAVVFLDVVMETNDSGLRTVDQIRHTLNNKMVRIILRTGQPGEAPEEKIIVDYDINDYRLKTELTVQRLYTTLFEALRSYRDLWQIELQRQRLERVVKFTSLLFEQPNLETFYQNVLKGMIIFMRDFKRVDCEEMITGYNGLVIVENKSQEKKIVAMTGEFDSENTSFFLEELFPLKGKFEALGTESIRFAEVVTFEKGFMICKSGKNGTMTYIYIEEDVNQFDMELIRQFLIYYASSLDNCLHLHQMIESNIANGDLA